MRIIRQIAIGNPRAANVVIPDTARPGAVLLDEPGGNRGSAAILPDRFRNTGYRITFGRHGV